MNISLPTTLKIENLKNNKAAVSIEPCYPGYGVTLGNALRRVLLSSINGAAVTSFKINGAEHEFSTLPYVKEDLVELMLNLKNIRVKVFVDEPVVLNLAVKGDKVVTAGDIAKNSDVEVVNPDSVICTLTDKKANLEMELTVEKGMGYIPVEERVKEKLPIGTIMVDAIYTPLVNVGFEVENVRVGQMTDYERVILNIETDGTITPQEALAQANEILTNHFQFIQENIAVRPAKEVKKSKDEAEEKIVNEETDEAIIEKPAKKSAKKEDKPVKKTAGRKKKDS